jgi:hypothetical protein
MVGTHSAHVSAPPGDDLSSGRRLRKRPRDRSYSSSTGGGRAILPEPGQTAETDHLVELSSTLSGPTMKEERAR